METANLLPDDEFKQKNRIRLIIIIPIIVILLALLITFIVLYAKEKKKQILIQHLLIQKVTINLYCLPGIIALQNQN